MAHAFDTLGYSQRLREAGVPQKQAEAHAAAARDFVMADLVTQADLAAVRKDLATESAATRTELAANIRYLELKIDSQTQRLTVRLGGIMVTTAGVMAGVVAGILKIFGHG